MNFCNITIFGGCLGLLAVLLISNFTNHLPQFLTFESLNKNHKLSISAEERLASSVWCRNRFDGTKFCKVKNLYHFPDFKGHFLFLMNEFSIVLGVEDLKQLSLSTVQNHTGLNLKLVIIKSVDYLLGQNISFLETDTFIMKSFKSDNIMHVIHDDLIPLFVTYKELCSGDISLCVLSYRLILIDNNDDGPYFQWYMHFSALKPIIIATEKYPLCTKRGFFGLSNSSIWFQYGFKNTQGPLLNSFFNRFLLVEFTEFIRHQFGLSTEEIHSTTLDTTVFFSRKINRKIINEDFMEVKMKNIAQSIHKTNITILNLDLSTNNSNSIIDSLQRSQLLVGMHGSAMILAIFMQPGSQIMELFPFGIQPEYVSPLRALCKLQNINYHYESWVNMNEFNTRTHPEYPPLLGGVFYLDEAKRNVIMNIKKVPAVECCHDPVYLFRMFQDTIVDDSFFILFHKVVSNYTGWSMPKQKLIEQKQKEFMMNNWYFPPPVFNLSCKCDGGTVKLLWDYPFRYPGIQFSVATSNGILAVTKQTNFVVTIGECNIDKVSNSPKQLVEVWVKAVDGKKDSLDSFARCINTDQVTPS